MSKRNYPKRNVTNRPIDYAAGGTLIARVERAVRRSVLYLPPLPPPAPPTTNHSQRRIDQSTSSPSDVAACLARAIPNAYLLISQSAFAFVKFYYFLRNLYYRDRRWLKILRFPMSANQIGSNRIDHPWNCYLTCEPLFLNPPSTNIILNNKVFSNIFFLSLSFFFFFFFIVDRQIWILRDIMLHVSFDVTRQYIFPRPEKRKIKGFYYLRIFPLCYEMLLVFLFSFFLFSKEAFQ